jgi:hypothetical protein
MCIMVSKTDGNRITSSTLLVNINLYPERRNTRTLCVHLFTFPRVSVALFDHHQVEKTSKHSEKNAVEEVSTSSFNLDGRRLWAVDATARPRYWYPPYTGWVPKGQSRRLRKIFPFLEFDSQRVAILTTLLPSAIFNSYLRTMFFFILSYTSRPSNLCFVFRTYFC